MCRPALGLSPTATCPLPEDPDPEELIAALQALAVASAPSNPTSVAPSPASSHPTPLHSDPPPASGATQGLGWPWWGCKPGGGGRTCVFHFFSLNFGTIFFFVFFFAFGVFCVVFF